MGQGSPTAKASRAGAPGPDVALRAEYQECEHFSEHSAGATGRRGRRSSPRLTGSRWPALGSCPAPAAVSADRWPERFTPAAGTVGSSASGT